MFLNKFVLLVGTSCCSLVAAAGAGQYMRRDLGSIQGALAGVNTALARLDSAILKNPADPKVLFTSISVLESIQQATDSINASQPLGSDDTSNLKATTDSLVSNVNLTVTDLIKQKPVFDRLKLDKVVLLQVQNIQGAALVLASTLASKVDPTASALALDGISALNAALQRGIEVYSGTAAGPTFTVTESPAVELTTIRSSSIGPLAAKLAIECSTTKSAHRKYWSGAMDDDYAYPWHV
ncbi:hypothetical protein KVR01_000697 [Diaporthe batatas]|uniref:uncharacterized protein n=1 Tax=Diaporthe batatas TaxID=748121 RepID=UPI001D051184|nr:uncharacterized protein KVR01_000697 [Diaporthe batatas]KAG8169952.1 hypothetical protein KVR01_000697 [Diaporthe batatas]